jgi:hypothetical protein
MASKLLNISPEDQTGLSTIFTSDSKIVEIGAPCQHHRPALNFCQVSAGVADSARRNHSASSLSERLLNHAMPIISSEVGVISIIPPSASAVIGPEQLSLFGPVGAFAGTIMGIIQPVLIDFANLASDFEKKKAIKSFLSDASNQGKSRDSGIGLGRTGSDFLFAKRLSLAGTFAEQVAIVTGDSLDLSSKSVQVACPTPYDTMYRRGPDGLPSAQFRRCYRAVWGHFEDGIAAALKTAAAYDQLADAGDTSTQLNGYKALTTDFSKVADESGQVDFWDTVSKMLTFAGAVETAVSQDSLKKLQQSLDAVSKGK